MDNLPKEEREETQVSGDIFTPEQVAGGVQPQEATSAAGYQQEGQSPPEQETSGEVPQEQMGVTTEGNPPPGLEEAPPTSPPFVEDARKKYLVLGIGIVLLLLVLGVLVKLIFGKKGALPSQNVVLTYWGLWEDKEIIQPILDNYKRINPKVTVNYIKQDKQQFRERLQAAFTRSEGPDIFRFHNTWVPMLIRDLSPMPKTVYADSDYEKIFYPVVTADLKVQGNYYGIPLMIDGLLLFYNEDILKGANVKPPISWLDVQSAASTLTVKEKERIVTAAIAMGTAENIEHFSDILALMMLQNGTQLTKSFFSCSDPSSSSCAVEALTFYRKFAETPNNVWDDTLDNSIIAFAEGKAAMIFAPSWQIFTIKTLNPNLNFKLAQVPQLPCDKEPCPRVDLASYWIEGVSVKSKYQAQAWEFLKYLSTEETMKTLYNLQVQSRKLFGEPYSRVSLATTLSDNQYLVPLIAQAPHMKSFYLTSRTFDGETGLNSTLIKYLKDAVNSLGQGVSPEEALKTADEGFKQVYSRFGITSAQ